MYAQYVGELYSMCVCYVEGYVCVWACVCLDCMSMWSVCVSVYTACVCEWSVTCVGICMHSMCVSGGACVDCACGCVQYVCVSSVTCVCLGICTHSMCVSGSHEHEECVCVWVASWCPLSPHRLPASRAARGEPRPFPPLRSQLGSPGQPASPCAQRL